MVHAPTRLQKALQHLELSLEALCSGPMDPQNATRAVAKLEDNSLWEGGNKTVAAPASPWRDGRHEEAMLSTLRPYSGLLVRA